MNSDHDVYRSCCFVCFEPKVMDLKKYKNHASIMAVYFALLSVKVKKQNYCNYNFCEACFHKISIFYHVNESLVALERCLNDQKNVILSTHVFSIAERMENGLPVLREHFDISQKWKSDCKKVRYLGGENLIDGLQVSITMDGDYPCAMEVRKKKEAYRHETNPPASLHELKDQDEESLASTRDSGLDDDNMDCAVVDNNSDRFAKETNQSYVCRFAACREQFSSTTARDQHQAIHYKTSDGKYRCIPCNKKFNTVELWSGHQLCHRS